MKGNIKLIIFPVNRQLLDFLKVSIKNILINNKVKNYKITSEKSFLVIEVKDYLQVSQWLSNCSGIKRIGISVSTANNIKDILDMIVCVTDRITYSRKYFKIKVFSENSMYIPRDIEFMATGLILERLKFKNLKPTGFNRSDVTDVYCYISSSGCYIVYKFIEGINGLPFGYLKKSIFCICYDPYSLKSIEIISKFGFIPQILILYSSTNNLIKHLKCLYHVFLKMQMKQISVKLLKIYFNFDDNISDFDELKLIQLILSHIENVDVLIPFSFYTHPFSIIDKIITFCYQKRKIPWLPFAFLDLNNNTHFFSNTHISYIFEDKDKSSLRQKPNNRLLKSGESLNIQALNLKNIKTISFTMTSSNIRPNYIDNILNSI